MAANERKTRRAGRNYEPARWSISRAAMEFDIEERTLSKRLRAASIEPGEDGCFGTMDICRARFSDYEVARARNEAAKADMAELAYRERCGELVEVDKVTKDIAETVSAARQIILNCGMPRLEAYKVLQMLADLAEHPVSDEPGDAPGD